MDGASEDDCRVPFLGHIGTQVNFIRRFESRNAAFSLKVRSIILGEILRFYFNN